MVSNQNAKFNNMNLDEKLEVINLAIEYKLKKYIEIDSDKLFLDFITNDLIKNIEI